MSSGRDDTVLAWYAADAISRAFEAYRQQFAEITRRAKSRFENQDWHGMQRDAVERLDVYARVIALLVVDIRSLLGERVHDRALWAQMKAATSAWIARRADFELAETFFNSVTRRIFATIGVDPKIEYVDSDFDAPPQTLSEPVYVAFTRHGSTRSLIADMLAHYRFAIPYESLDRDTRLVEAEIQSRWGQAYGEQPIESIEVVKPVFYRNQGAYLIGRIRGGDGSVPLAVALRSGDEGVVVDAVLLTEDEVSIVFSFTRSYFHVDVEQPHDVIRFLKSIMPLKRVAELYIALGYNKHGKTELYRDLLRHLHQSDDKFVIAPGDRGMVMVVFTLPSYDIVFKVIRDKCLPPKTATRQDVMDRYQLVFKHDRAGRLVDAQEFEHLAFTVDRFSDDLLAELREAAPGSVTIQDGIVDIKHLYTERRITPLNLYLRDAQPVAAAEAVLDYGEAIKDLAATNIFPGDLLLKNFGVTRHGRVIFYDYDELCLVTDCNFRDMPRARDDEEEMQSEPWFYVGPNDIFPDEFMRFLGFRGHARETFLEAHRDLLTAGYWRRVRERHIDGEIIDIFPYRQSKRLRARS
ncbi:MAG TPA: bifunctional isocitrate dehydrogenase kinase/phosphatase [Anaerolineae bacterium]|nr:bifunctional isocitrate dehydrogenase kinase/phosphatase [Anaerolineae bacterium]